MPYLETVQELLEAKEGEHVQFKEAKNRFDFGEAAKCCCALANNGGGKLVFGITDKRPRSVVGSAAFDQPERTRMGLIRIGNRIFCAPTRSEPIRVLIELCFADWLHDLQNTLLYYSVNNTRYSQRPHLSVWLWYFYSFYCFWFIPPELFLDELYKLILWHDCQ